MANLKRRVVTVLYASEGGEESYTQKSASKVGMIPSILSMMTARIAFCSSWIKEKTGRVHA